MLWPFTLLWWVWRRSAWGSAGKIVVTAVVALVFLAYAIALAVAPRTSQVAASANPSSSASDLAAPISSAVPPSADSRSQVLKWSYFGDAWPLSVPEATVSCRGASAVVLTVEGKDYAVNGSALTQYKSMATIRDDGLWKDAESGAGTKISIGPIIDIGLGLCEGKAYTPTPVTTATVMPTSTLTVPAASTVSAGCDAAFAAWEPLGGTLEPSDPRVVATLTKCASVAEWRGGLEKRPMALDYEAASEIDDGAVRADLWILCATEARRSSPVCADAVKRAVVR